MQKELTPRQIVEALDKYVIGQNEAKKSVAIALRNRWRRLNASKEMRDEIMPNNIIMIGPTGVGKTEIARRLAKLANAPFIKVEATKFTEVGYVGRDVESIVRDITEFSINMVREEHEKSVSEKAKVSAEERILDILIPPAKSRETVETTGTGFAITTGTSGDGGTGDEADLRERTRQKFREKLGRGDLDGREIEIEIEQDPSSTLQVFGPMGMEEMGVNLQDLFGGLTGKRSKKKRVSVPEAREILTKQEAQRLIDMDKVVREALERVQNSGIVFIDEIDKVAARTGSSGPDVSREGVQRDLLPIVEGSGVMTKHGLVKTDHILFIASGAFHISKPSDLIPELQGRFPIRVELSSLGKDEFVAILKQPKNALLKQYQALLATEGVSISFTDEAVDRIASIAAQVNDEVENIGARRLHTILTTLLDEILFNTPDEIESHDVTITAEMVNEKLNSIVHNRDLSQYIL